MKGLALLIALAVLVVACGGDETAATTTTTTTTTTTVDLDTVPQSYEEFRARPTACGGDQPEAVREMAFDEPADLGLTGTVTATIETSCGPLVVALDATAAPETVNSFVFLAEQGYFDGTAAHRVLPGFIVQAGDPTATGRGGPGYTIADEFPPEGFVYTKGTLAMANAGPGTTGSQFFIMVGDAGLPPAYSVFGEVVSGLETLQRIEQVPLGLAPGSPDPAPSTPLETIYIESVAVDR